MLASEESYSRCRNTSFPVDLVFVQSGHSSSTKIHFVCRHIVRFISDYLPKGMGIGAVSKQAEWTQCSAINEGRYILHVKFNHM